MGVTQPHPRRAVAAVGGALDVLRPVPAPPVGEEHVEEREDGGRVRRPRHACDEAAERRRVVDEVDNVGVLQQLSRRMHRQQPCEGLRLVDLLAAREEL